MQLSPLITRLKIGGQDLDQTHVLSLDVFENIEYPAITGQILFQDWNDFKVQGELFGGEFIDITMSNNNEEAIDMQFVITGTIADEARREKVANIGGFTFTSPWYVKANTIKRSRYWLNTSIHEIISDLIEECGGVPGVFIPTKQVLERFVTPYWAPIDIIRYLLSFAQDEDGNGGYLLWTDLEDGSVQFAPISRLLAGDYGDAGLDMSMFTQVEDSYERMYNLNMLNAHDIVHYGHIGAGHSRLIGFNYDRTELMTADLRADEVVSNRLSTAFPLNIDYLGLRYRTTKFYPNFHNTNELIVDNEDDLILGRVKTKMSLLSSDIFSFTFSTPGEIQQKRAGRLIRMGYPSMDGDKTSENTQYSGKYLIKANRHTFQGRIYGNSLLVVSDGFKEINRNDIISWNKDTNDSNMVDLSKQIDGDRFDADTFVAEDIISDVITNPIIESTT